MTSKEFLRQAHNLNAQINEHIREKEDLRRMVGSISCPVLGDRVQSSVSGEAAFTRVVEKIILLEEQITKEIDRLVDLKTAIFRSLNQMENPDERLVLQYRYCSNDSWEDIALNMNTSVRSVHRIHAAALKNFIVPI